MRASRASGNRVRRTPNCRSPATPTADYASALPSSLQLQQLDGQLTSAEKAIKARSLDFSNRIFSVAQVKQCHSPLVVAATVVA